ncbi:nesprin-2-like [Carcharodon carcharias]|uniref:nesprin-2-like n=1 Tax=Carcharodon carcharias TaxID=13397 RepID=UPI001B7EFA18|nr:nesprin-2-like [Carcharodon carcharias]
MHRDECRPSGLADSPLSFCWIIETEENNAESTSRMTDRQQCDICAPSLERRIKMEQSWQLWQAFLDDYSRFNDWMRWAEAVAKEPQSSQVLYTEAKEELKRFESLRKQAEEYVIRLESINRRYRRLAKEQWIRLAGQLRGMVHDGNQRWDNLQRRVGIICKRLKYFVTQREEFEAERENLWLQLMELDIQRTELEYFSQGEATEKLIRLQVFQQMITCISDKTDELLMAAEVLLQKSESQDSVTIEDEVWDLLQFQQDVFGQVSRFHKRCHSAAQVFDEWELANQGGSEPDRHCHTILAEQRAEDCGSSLVQHLLCEGAPSDHQSGRSSPSSVDSLSLEWDSYVDIEETMTHEGNVSFHHSVLDKPDDLNEKGRVSGWRRNRPTHRRVKSDSNILQQVDVACQCDIEVNPILGDPGPLFDTEMQAVSDRLPQDVAGDEQTIAETLRKTNGHCWMWQNLYWEQTKGRVHSDWLQSQSLGPQARAGGMEQWLQMLEPKQKLCVTEATTLGVTAEVNRLLHVPSTPLAGKDLPYVHPVHSLQHLLVAIILLLVLVLMVVLLFVLPAVIQECNWHRRNTFQPFHFTLTYINGPPPT